MTEKDAYTELYSQFTLEQLEHRLPLIDEAITSTELLLNTHKLRKEIIEALIEKERNRLTEYYSQQGAP